MEQFYFVARNNQKQGPFSFTELKDQAAAGQLGPKEMLLPQGATHWTTADAVDGLFDTVAEPPAPPAPEGASAPPAPEVAGAAPAAAPAAAPQTAGRSVSVLPPGIKPWMLAVGAGAVLLPAALAVLTTAIVVVVNWGRPAPVPQVLAEAQGNTEKAVEDEKQPPATAIPIDPNVPEPVAQKGQGPTVPPDPELSKPKVSGPNEPNPKKPAAPAGKPEPVEPAPATPAPPPPEYIALARAISNQFAADLTQPKNLQMGPPITDLLVIMKQLSAAKNPVVAGAVAKLEGGRQRAIQAVNDVQASANAAQKNMEEVLHAAERGAYTEKIERVYQTEDSSGNIRTVRSTVTVDNSGLPVFGATALNLWVQANAPEKMKYRAAVAMEEARLETWNELVPKLADIYPKSPAEPHTVRFRITPPDAKTGRGPQFAVSNAGRRTLTNVTLALDLVHFTTAPEATAYQVYFIPRWEAGKEFYLPVACVRNRATEEYAKGRPVLADPAGTNPYAGPAAEKHPWLASIGGLVEVTGTLWASEAHQAAEAFPFPAQAEEGARWEMKIATQLIRGLVEARMKNLPPNAKVQVPEGLWPTRAARRVLKFAPADSAPARQARLLLEDPQTLLRVGATQHTGTSTAMTRPGTVFQGDWKLDVKGFGIGVPADVRRAAQDQKDRGGKISLRIDTRDLEAGTVTATLFDPDDPKKQRPLTGRITRNEATGKLHLGFPANGARPDFAPEHLQLLTTPSAIYLSTDTGALAGTSPGYPFPGCYTIVVNLSLSVAGPADPKEPPAKKPGDDSKALLAMMKPGTEHRGDWSLHVEGFGPGVHGNIRKAITDRRDRTGKLVLRVDACNAETRAVTATLTDPDQPGFKRELKGEVMEDQRTGKTILFFPGAKVPGRPGGFQINKDFLDFSTAPGDIKLQVGTRGLTGRLPGPLYPSCYWYVLNFDANPATGKAP